MDGNVGAVRRRARRRTAPSPVSQANDIQAPRTRKPPLKRAGAFVRSVDQAAFFGSPWQRLYFLPEPQGHGALRSTLP